MSEWVAVCGEEAEEPVEIPTEADGQLARIFNKIYQIVYRFNFHLFITFQFKYF